MVFLCYGPKLTARQITEKVCKSLYNAYELESKHIFLDKDSFSSINDHLIDFAEAPSSLSSTMPLSDHKWILPRVDTWLSYVQEIAFQEIIFHLDLEFAPLNDSWL